MRRLLLLSAALFAVVALQAQSLEAFKERLASGSMARVAVTEHGDAATIVARTTRPIARQYLEGYRVCIFVDNGQGAREDAAAAKSLFETTFPGVRVYMVYENPYFKVSVGNCLTAEEAVILQGRVSGIFPKAFKQNAKIQLSELLN